MPKNDIRLLIAIPCMDSMPYLFVDSLTNLVRRLEHESVNFEVKIEGGTLIYLARDSLVKYAMANEFTHILWLDSDMTFDNDIFEKLLSHNKDFVCGLYQSRHAENRPVMFKDLGRSERYSEYPDELFPIEACGFACVLMKTHLAAKIMSEYGSCFMPSLFYGEDLEFCNKLLKHGYEMYSDPNAKVGHIGRAVLKPGEPTKFV